MERKAVSGIMLTLLFIGMLTLAFDVQEVKVSNAVSPYIAVVPESTVDPALTPGMNYTISIYTDYNGSDVWGYEITLTYNPNVLEGIEVVNGDLITEDVGTTMWFPGTFNNTEGTLVGVGNAFFAMPGESVPVTSGPGILTNITFSVVGYGDSYISLGDGTRLIGYDDIIEVYNIIDKYYPDLGHILGGYFANQLEVTHDIAVVSVTPSTNEVEEGELLNVTVVVENEGTVIEYVTVEVYRDYEPGLTFWFIGKRSVILEAGATKSLVFVWDTIDAPLGEHTVTAVAIELPGEDDVADNMLESHEIVRVMYTWLACIRANGSIDPPTANITSVDNITYTFTDNIVGDVPIYSIAILVQRDNIVVDGAGYILQGTGGGTGINMIGRSNVTIKNVEVTNFTYGIYLYHSSNNTVTGNTASSNGHYGICLDFSSNNTVTGNTASNNDYGISILASSNNNTITGNTASNNWAGIWLGYSSNNVLFHNNLVSNTVQAGVITGYVNTWDDGYPSGGNYWSNYNGVDLDHDGIGDTEHVIDANNKDNYPLMGMFSDFTVWDNETYHITTICNFTISDFNWGYSMNITGTWEKALYFNVFGPEDTVGFCRIMIPRAFLEGPYTVLFTNEVNSTELPISNSTHVFLYITYNHSGQVMIVPEFPAFLILPLFMVTTLLAVIIYRRKHPIHR